MAEQREVPSGSADAASAGPSEVPPPMPNARRGRPRKTASNRNQRQQGLTGGSGDGSGQRQQQTPETSSSPTAEDDGNFTSEAEDPLAIDYGNAAQRWINSTALPVRRSQTVSAEHCIDPADRLSAAIERTLSAVREASLGGEGSSHLVNRLTTAKSLPVFSGDPLEWLHFKEAYLLTSESGGYSDRENIARLFDALRGEARDVVKTLLASSRDADAIIRTLELHFGNKKIVAEKIVADLKALPEIESGKISLVQFATKLRSAVSAFTTFKLMGYLHSPELVKSVGSKIPVALRYAYNRYAVSVAGEKSELEKLADFIYSEAELATEAGIFDIDITPDRSTQRSDALNRPRRQPPRTAVVCVTDHNRKRGQRAESNASAMRNCVFCKKDNHASPKCLFFAREPLQKRWELVKKHNLCYGCLKSGHMRNECRNVKCSFCQRRHHSLLHKQIDADRTKQENQREISSSENSVSRQTCVVSDNNDGDKGCAKD